MAQLPSSALNTHVFPDDQLKIGLLGTPQLCDHDLTVVYSKEKVTVLSPTGTLLLEQPRSGTSSLWHINTIPTTPANIPSSLSCFNVYPIPADNAAICLYWQRCFGSPTKSSFIRAAHRQSFAKLFPLLTPKFISKNYQHTAATAIGHLNRHRKNQHSTQPPVSGPSQQLHPKLLISFYQPTRANYSDATGTFLGTNLHFLIMYHQDSNYINAIALHDYSAASYHTAYMEGLALYQRAKPDGSFIPHIEYADNAMTKAYIAAMKKHKIEVQLVPPSNHRANNAERAVQTFKNHFISSLATCDPLYPAPAAENILPTVKLTLNLLRASNISGLSAHEEMHGPFDSNRYHLHPIGTRVITLDAPENRPSFAPHGVEGFYIGPAMQHYRCHEIYCPHSKAIRTSDSVSWLPFERIIPKYATLPEEIFAGEPTPIHPTIANTTHLTSSQGVASPNDDTPWVPITNSQGANTILEPPTPSTPPHSFCPDDIISSVPTPHTIADHPFSSPSPINAPQANFVHYSKAIRGPDYQHWQDSMHAEIVRLFITTKTALYRPDLTIDTIPSDARVGNANPVIKKKENKIDPSQIEYRTRLTFHEINRKRTPTTNTSIEPPIIEPRITASSTIDSLAVKLLYNSIVSDHEAIFSSIDVKDWYLNSSCDTAFLLIRNGILDEKSKILLGTTHLPDNASLVIEVNNVVYGMDDAGRISQLELVNHLAKDDFHMCPHTPGLFYHATRPNIRFTTWADDFGIKSNPASGDFEFLCDVLKKKYPITAHKTATKYLGMNIDLVRHVDPSKDTLTCSMPGFVKESLAELGFVRTFSPKSPSIYIAPKFGGTTQDESIDTSPPATAEQQTHLRTAIGKFRWYGDAVDPILVTPLSKMANQQSAPTENTMSELSRFLNYVDQFPNAQLTFKPSNMQLYIHQ